MSTRTEEKLTALLRCSEAPSDSQRDRLLAFLKERYGDNVTGLDWEKDDTLRGGFRLQVGADIYDWSREGLLRRFKDYLRDRKLGDGELIPLMREVIDDFEPDSWCIPVLCRVLLNQERAVYFQDAARPQVSLDQMLGLPSVCPYLKKLRRCISGAFFQ